MEQIGPLAREWVIQDLSHVQWWMSMTFFLARGEKRSDTVDGRNPAPVDRENIPFFIGFHR